MFLFPFLSFPTNQGYGRDDGQSGGYPIGVIARGPVGSGGTSSSAGTSAPTNGGSNPPPDADGYPSRFEGGTRSGAGYGGQQQPFSRRAPLAAGATPGVAPATLGERYGYSDRLPNTNTLSIGPSNIASSSGRFFLSKYNLNLIY